jgi:serine/threonine protein kinase
VSSAPSSIGAREPGADRSTSDQFSPPPESAELSAEYVFRGELGRGGAAVVFLAEERKTGRDVAIKLIRSPLAADSETLQRFAREARTAALLQHPNIVALHTVKRLRSGALALVMECVDGGTLKERIRRSAPLPFDEVERVMRSIGSALLCAHRRGIVHRDVKPENIFIDDRTGRALLADFGIARTGEADCGLTLQGVALGTPAYMAPEQIDGGEVDGRADIYSLALVAWEMLTGESPWEGESLYGVIYRQKHERLAPPSTFRPGLPEPLERVIERASAKDPEGRYPDAAAFLRALDEGPPRSAWTRFFRGFLPSPRLARPMPIPELREGDGRIGYEPIPDTISTATDGPPNGTGAGVEGATIRFRRETGPPESPPTVLPPAVITSAPSGEIASPGPRPGAEPALPRPDASRRSATAVRIAATAHSRPLGPVRHRPTGVLPAPGLEPEEAGAASWPAVPAADSVSDDPTSGLLEAGAPPPPTVVRAAFANFESGRKPRPVGRRQPAVRAAAAAVPLILVLATMLNAPSGTRSASAPPGLAIVHASNGTPAPAVVELSSALGGDAASRYTHLCIDGPAAGILCWPAGSAEKAGTAFVPALSQVFPYRCRFFAGGPALCRPPDRQAGADPERSPLPFAAAGHPARAFPCFLARTGDVACWRDRGLAELAAQDGESPVLVPASMLDR